MGKLLKQIVSHIEKEAELKGEEMSIIEFMERVWENIIRNFPDTDEIKNAGDLKNALRRKFL